MADGASHVLHVDAVMGDGPFMGTIKQRATKPALPYRQHYMRGP